MNAWVDDLANECIIIFHFPISLSFNYFYISCIPFWCLLFNILMRAGIRDGVFDCRWYFLLLQVLYHFCSELQLQFGRISKICVCLVAGRRIERCLSAFISLCRSSPCMNYFKTNYSTLINKLYGCRWDFVAWC